MEIYPEQTTINLTPEAKRKAVEMERRSQERCRCKRRPTVRVLARPGFQVIAGTLRDISTQGLGLILQKPLDTGSVLAIQLHVDDAGISGVLTGHVRHSTRLADGSWLIGCKLTSPLTSYQVFLMT